MMKHRKEGKYEESDTEPETSEPIEASAEETNILIVYFSRWGNTEYPDDVDATTSASIVADGENYGTTEYVARMIQENVGGDLHLIQTQEPYPTDFNELRDLNHSEMAEGYLPALVESNLDISWYDTALAQEIKDYFPLTISMSGFGGREYYGGVDFYPAEENLVGGGKTFENGDITYCEDHHNMAIFYAQTDNPIFRWTSFPLVK